jgi:shikimate kinase
VRIGDLDPLEETSGVRMRLEHLRYLTLLDDRDVESWELARAIVAFQLDAGIEPTGSLDDATRSALRAAHGS